MAQERGAVGQNMTDFSRMRERLTGDRNIRQQRLQNYMGAKQTALSNNYMGARQQGFIKLCVCSTKCISILSAYRARPINGFNRSC